MFMDGFADLTDSFNSAIITGAHTLAAAASVGVLFSMVDDDKNRRDEMAPLKSVAKLSILGML